MFNEIISIQRNNKVILLKFQSRKILCLQSHDKPIPYGISIGNLLRLYRIHRNEFENG